MDGNLGIVLADLESVFGVTPEWGAGPRTVGEAQEIIITALTVVSLRSPGEIQGDYERRIGDALGFTADDAERLFDLPLAQAVPDLIARLPALAACRWWTLPTRGLRPLGPTIVMWVVTPLLVVVLGLGGGDPLLALLGLILGLLIAGCIAVLTDRRRTRLPELRGATASQLLSAALADFQAQPAETWGQWVTGWNVDGDDVRLRTCEVLAERTGREPSELTPGLRLVEDLGL